MDARLALDVNSDAESDAADGILIARYLHGVVEGGALTAGWSATAAADVADEIKSLEASDAVEQ